MADITGQIDITVTMDSTMEKLTGRIMSGSVLIRPVMLSNMSRPIIIKPNWTRRQYLCELTGTPNLSLPMTGFTASLTVSGDSTLSVSLTGAAHLIDDILDRKTGDLVIKRVYQFSDGSTTITFIRVNYGTLSATQDPKGGTKLTLTGSKRIKATAYKSVNLTGASYRNYNDGLLRYRCSIDEQLNPGDTAIINGEQFVVGKITYTVGSGSDFMEIAEYNPDGLDGVSGIGANARPVLLTEYAVLLTDANYYLWVYNALAYNGITASGETVGQPYLLYKDSDGLLWYLAGFEGYSNIPVYLIDGTTQASV